MEIGTVRQCVRHQPAPGMLWQVYNFGGSGCARTCSHLKWDIHSFGKKLEVNMKLCIRRVPAAVPTGDVLDSNIHHSPPLHRNDVEVSLSICFVMTTARHNIHFTLPS